MPTSWNLNNTLKITICNLSASVNFILFCFEIQYYFYLFIFLKLKIFYTWVCGLFKTFWEFFFFLSFIFLFAYDIQVYYYQLFKRLPFLHYIAFELPEKIIWKFICESMSCYFISIYPPPLSFRLDYCCYYVLFLKSFRLILPLFYLFKNCCCYFSSFTFPFILEQFIVYVQKHPDNISTGVALTLSVLERIKTFTILNLTCHKHNMFLWFIKTFNFLYQTLLNIPIYESYTSLCILYWEILKIIIFLILICKF